MKSPLAQIYNDQSPLENFHALSLIQIMHQSGLGSLLEDRRLPDLRKSLIGPIIATDMSIHFDISRKAETLSWKMAQSGSKIWSLSDRFAVLALLLKCADVSNPLRPFDISAAWSDALAEEWSVQVDLEREMGIPTSLSNVRENSRYTGQITFMDLFVIPLYQLTASLPGLAEMNRFCQLSAINRELWRERFIQDGRARGIDVADDAMAPVSAHTDEKSGPMAGGHLSASDSATVHKVNHIDTEMSAVAAAVSVLSNGEKHTLGSDQPPSRPAAVSSAEKTDRPFTKMQQQPIPSVKSKSKLNVRLNPHHWKITNFRKRSTERPNGTPPTPDDGQSVH